MNFHNLAYGTAAQRRNEVLKLDDDYTNTLATIRKKSDAGEALEAVCMKFDDQDNVWSLVEAVACNADDATIAELVRSQVKRAADWINEERESE